MVVRALFGDRFDLGLDRGERPFRDPGVDVSAARAPFGLPLDAEAKELEPLVEVDNRGLLLRQAQPDGGQHGNDLLPDRLGGAGCHRP